MLVPFEAHKSQNVTLLHSNFTRDFRLGAVSTDLCFFNQWKRAGRGGRKHYQLCAGSSLLAGRHTTMLWGWGAQQHQIPRSFICHIWGYRGRVIHVLCILRHGRRQSRGIWCSGAPQTQVIKKSRHTAHDASCPHKALSMFGESNKLKGGRGVLCFLNPPLLLLP